MTETQKYRRITPDGVAGGSFSVIGVEYFKHSHDWNFEPRMSRLTCRYSVSRCRHLLVIGSMPLAPPAFS